jgi:hypothetical protein
MSAPVEHIRFEIRLVDYPIGLCYAWFSLQLGPNETMQ